MQIEGINLAKEFKNWDEIAQVPTQTQKEQVTRCLSHYYEQNRHAFSFFSTICAGIVVASLLAVDFDNLESMIWLSVAMFFLSFFIYLIRDRKISTDQIVKAAIGDFDVLQTKIAKVEYDPDATEVVMIGVTNPNVRGVVGPFKVKSIGVDKQEDAYIVKIPGYKQYFAFTTYMLEEGVYLESIPDEEYIMPFEYTEEEYSTELKIKEKRFNPRDLLDWKKMQRVFSELIELADIIRQPNKI